MATPMSNGRLIHDSQAVSDGAGRTSASPEDLRLALRAATLYYLDGLTQAEIASRLGVSRPTAGRLIARAKANGLVRIEVVVPPTLQDSLHADEERELHARYVVIADGSLSRFGRALGNQRDKRVVQGTVIGPGQVLVAPIAPTVTAAVTATATPTANPQPGSNE